MVQWDQWRLWSTGTQVESLAQYSGLRIRCCLSRWQMWLRSDPWPGNSMCRGAAKKEKKKSSTCSRFLNFFLQSRPVPIPRLTQLLLDFSTGMFYGPLKLHIDVAKLCIFPASLALPIVFPISVNGDSILPAAQAKALGVIFDSSLSPMS